jgi:hypothetical protein
MNMQWAAKRNEVVPDIGEINYAAEHIPFEIEPYAEDHFLLEGERIEIMDRLMETIVTTPPAISLPSIR